jgi:chorismate synthase
MATMLSIHKETDEVAQIQCGVDDTKELATFCAIGLKNRNKNPEDYNHIKLDENLTPNQFKKKYEVVNGSLLLRDSSINKKRAVYNASLIPEFRAVDYADLAKFVADKDNDYLMLLILQLLYKWNK